MVEQQKIDIAEESTATAKKKKETEEHNSTSDKEDQENAPAIEPEELRENT
jgi:hypothetical protein